VHAAAAPVLAGPSAIVVIIIFVLAMLSPVQAIISAEAGVSAKAENMAAVIKILFIGTSSLEMKPAYCWLSIYVLVSGAFLQQRHFVCCNAVEKTPSGRFFAKTTVNEPGTRRRTMS
jgi:hypothetical protein